MKTLRWLFGLLALAGLSIGCEEDGGGDDGTPHIIFELDAACANAYPNGVAITFDDEPIGTVMAGDDLRHDTSEGSHTWSARNFGSHTVTIHENGVIQPLVCND